MPPTGEQLASPYEPEVRYSIKRGHIGVGYKVHLTGTCDNQSPHLVTQVETTIAPVRDVF